MPIDTEQGYVGLLYAIADRGNNRLWLRFGLVPPDMKQCLDCGKLIPRRNKYGGRTIDYCPECYDKRHYVILRCGHCGKEFRLQMSDYNARMRERKVPEFFCSRHCYGKYWALLFGFGVYPEHSGRGGRIKKVDHFAIFTAWKERKCTQKELGEVLAVPRSTVGVALRSYPSYFNRLRKPVGGCYE